jgi:hypothetical protein
VQAFFVGVDDADRFAHLFRSKLSSSLFVGAMALSGPVFGVISDTPALESSLSTGAHYTTVQAVMRVAAV